MEHTRKHKMLMLLALFVSIVSLSVGFAAFSTTLNISSSASVTPNSNNFSVKLSTEENTLAVGPVVPAVGQGVISASNGIITNSLSPTLSNLSATFSTVEPHIGAKSALYIVYARNEGEYTAYLNSIKFLGEKICTPIGDSTAEYVQDACSDVYVSVSLDPPTDWFSSDREFMGRAIQKGESLKFYIQVAYSPAYVLPDGPFSIELPEVAMIFSTVDNPNYTPSNMGTANEPGSLNSKIKALATSTDENINFSFNGWDGNSGVFIRKGTENKVNPIYYYRGDVNNNNVLFANKCWLIVRTTETGGIKLIYNGIPTADNKCNGDNSLIGYSAYNGNNQTIEDVSYIHSDGTNSTIKQAIDTWYSSNLVGYTDWLEDAVWCNDQTITFEGYHEPMNMNITFFDDYARNMQSHKPLLHCPTEYSLTTSSTQISKKLTYPVGLLTADELTLAGMGRLNYKDTGYLNNNEYWWGMSPFYFRNDFAVVFLGGVDGMLSGGGVYVEYGARPAISLKAGTTVTSGDGTPSKPYVIE